MIINQNENKIKLTELDKNLYSFRLKKAPESNPKDLEILKQKFQQKIKELNGQILSYELDSYQDDNSLIESSGMTIKKKKDFYSKELSVYQFDKAKLNYKPLNEFTKEIVLDIFSKITKGDNNIEPDTNQEFEDLIEYAEDKTWQDKWQMVLNDQEIIGMVLPQVFQDDSKEGSLFYVGLLPKFRAKGFGKEIHAKGLQFLKDYGAEKYVGSTLVENKAMMKVFEKNKCDKQYTQLYYQLS